jgi:hypothetical protein
MEQLDVPYIRDFAGVFAIIFEAFSGFFEEDVDFALLHLSQ